MRVENGAPLWTKEEEAAVVAAAAAAEESVRSPPALLKLSLPSEIRGVISVEEEIICCCCCCCCCSLALEESALTGLRMVLAWPFGLERVGCWRAGLAGIVHASLRIGGVELAVVSICGGAGGDCCGGDAGGNCFGGDGDCGWFTDTGDSAEGTNGFAFI